MPPNFHYSFRTQIPFSLIPCLPYTEQFTIIQSVLNTLEKMETSDQRIFLRIISHVREKRFEEILSTIKPLGENIWKHHNLCFIYNPKMFIHDLFMEKKGLPVLKEVKKNLQSKCIKWVCLINQETIYLFTLSSNGFLLWSPILQGITPYFLASILSDISILDSIDDLWRYNHLEKEKSQLLNFINKEFNRNLHNLENTESIISYYLYLISTLLKTKEKLITRITKELKSSPSSDHFKDLLRIRFLIQKIFTQDEDRFLESFLEPSEIKAWKEIFRNFSFIEHHWILDIPHILFLEILPYVKSNGDLQEFGEFYTPIALAEAIISRSFDTYIEKGLTKPITSLRVFDPAMGSGILLVFAMEKLVNFMISNTTQDDSFINLRRQVLKSCIQGVDIDRNSVSLCKIFLNTFYLLERENEELELGLEQKDFIGSFISHMKIKKPFPKFDIILSNPPYLAFHSRFRKKSPSKKELEILRKFIPVFSGKRDNTYLIFLGICLQQYLAPKGVVGFVIDHSFLDLPSYDKIREHLHLNYHISFILANYNYRKTAVVDLSLIVIQNTHNDLPTLWQETIFDVPQKISKEYFISQPNFIFRYKENISFLSHLNDTTIPLGSITSTSCGLEYGGLLRTHFLSSDAKEGFYKCIDGSNGLSRPYTLFWTHGLQNSYVRFDKEYEKRLQETNQDVSRTNKKVILISGKLERFLKDKIILRQTSPRFIGTLDKQKYLTLRNTHLIYDPKPPYSLYFILGILCSSLGNWIGEYFNIIRKPRKKSSRYPQIRLNDLKKFPIIDITQFTNNLMVNQVEIAVRECLDIGESITSVLNSLWVIFQEIGISYNSQRQFLRACFSGDILTHFTAKTQEEKVNHWLQFLCNELSKLSFKKKEIDSIVLKLYNINQKDQVEIISTIKSAS
ncbi:MAG: N-6 DNA methylase [Candidatus Heimdallarchaeota archaeon]|nr:MAG: N-6 DNA methylase [Candidatus Heimdallarchaeota archaeon]